MADSNHRVNRLLPQGPTSRPDLLAALLGGEVVLDGGPAPLDGDHLYLLVRDMRQDTRYHVVYAPADQEGFFMLVGATPVGGGGHGPFPSIQS